MTLKEYLRKQKISVSEVSRCTSIPRSTISDIVNGRTDIDNCSFGVIKKISECLKISIDELVYMCTPVVSKDFFSVYIANHKYYASYEYGGKTHRMYIHGVDSCFSKYVDFVAEWMVRDEIDRCTTEDKFNAILFDEKR